MEFDLSEEQRALQEAVIHYLAKAAPLDQIRRAADGDRGVGQALRKGLATLGVTALMVPESAGGLGMGVLEAALVQEALAQHAAPADIVADAVVAIALREAGSAEQQARWFAGILSGEVRFGAALSHLTGARDGASIQVHDTGGRIDGKSLFVLGSEDATHFVVADDAGGLWIVDRGATGLHISSLITVDATRHMGELRLERVQAEPLAATADSAAVSTRLIYVARTLLAADTLGAAQHMLELAVAYSMKRKQFGRVIGSFQAVKHMCAEMVAEIEPCRSLVWYAAYAADAVPSEANVMACHAKAHLSEVGQFVARTATEVHGGMGFTDEMGLHYWFKRIGLNRQLLGGPERLRDEAARLQGWIE